MGGWGRADQASCSVPSSPQLSEFWGLGSTSTPGTHYTNIKHALGRCVRTNRRRQLAVEKIDVSLPVVVGEGVAAAADVVADPAAGDRLFESGHPIGAEAGDAE